ncbi:hypothetical protein COCNU_04G009640 [Cocos nucifera]|uniref:Transmembrane protein n=1 Tax=Cocos nucifera TaxID=13894 RepID=A0A8K0N0G8_COCNU|nr:hypothetical protein COCNU_04G009640 [Cocos nucifera]
MEHHSRKLMLKESKLKDDDDDIEELLESLLKKLNHLVHLLKKLVNLVEKSNHLVQVFLTVVLTLALILLYLYHCSCFGKDSNKAASKEKSSSSLEPHAPSERRSLLSKLKVHLDLEP